MFDFEDDASRREKCYTTISDLPSYIDPTQPPSKKAPFSAIRGHSFVHTVEAVVPEEVYNTIQNSLHTKIQNIRYARVFMSLSSLLEEGFFNTYIKSGDILMVSEGQSGSDNVYSVRDGVLRLELGKEIFERTGLTGRPVRSGGRKHAKERYLIELNLRLPSMLHGKKGFERIVWAFKNVLNQSVAWLFYDLSPGSNGISEDTSLKGNHPHIIDTKMLFTRHADILAPSLSQINVTDRSPEEDLRESCEELSEWLGMVALGSPRVKKDDDTDPFLCRYSVPGPEGSPQCLNLVSLKWHGFIPPKWILQLFITLLRETQRVPVEGTWFALTSNALRRDAVEGKDGYTIMTLPKDANKHPKGSRSCVCWEYVGASIV
ncbi:ribonuclease P 40kDa subunit-domain-containing protein [Aspergillus ambiguus]|uniref:ribonuclease P protein subunit p40 n=1 Tax=Aspergillus ambiguus TaxID=176160 RepID=UPI003CCD683B